jgi:hypothetical protein
MRTSLVWGGGCVGVVLLLSCSGGDSPSRVRAGSSVRPTVFASDSQGANIRDIAVGHDIWVVNRGEPSVARYDRAGRVQWHGVARGEGPDQARAIWSVATIGDSAFAWDEITLRVMRIHDDQVSTEATLDFTTARSINPMGHGITFGHPGRFRRWGSGWVTYATKNHQGQAADLAKMVILHFTRDGQVADTLADLRPQGISALMDERGTGPAELVPVPLWDVCGDTRFVLFEPERQLLSWRDTAGARDSLGFDFTPEEIPESFMRAHLLWQLHVISFGRIPEEKLRQDVEQGFEGEKHTFGKETPFATSLFCDPKGMTWMQRFSLDAPPKGFSTEWLVIDLATKRQMSATFPTGFQAMAADSTLVYGVVEDEDGVQSVATLPRAAVLSELPR